MNVNEVRARLEALSRKKAQLIDQLHIVREAEWVWLRKYDAAQKEEFQIKGPDEISDDDIDKMSVEDLKKLNMKIKKSMVKKGMVGWNPEELNSEKVDERLERENVIAMNAEGAMARLETLARKKAKFTKKGSGGQEARPA